LKILTNPTKDELVNVIHTNRNETFKSLWKDFNSEIIQGENWTIYRTGNPSRLLNGIIHNCSNQQLIVKLDEIIPHFKKNNIPFQFFLAPENNVETHLDKILEKGLTITTTPGMTLDLTKLQEIELNTDQRKIVKVTTDKHIESASKIINEVFTPGKNFYNLWKHHVSTAIKNKAFETYVALLNDIPVGVSEVAYFEGVAGIYTVATLPEARGQGIGTAITLAPLFDAKDLGYEWSILHSSKMGYNVYKKIGYQDFGPYHHASWNPE
jgi:GNAT superfamily N-acetyltransferase